MRKFSPQDLYQHLNTTPEKPLLLDVREPWEFEYCHIDGSQLVPMGQVRSVVDRLDPRRETVVICHHGIRSRMVAGMLERAGFSNVINLEGGVEAWAQHIDPSMKRY